MFSCHRRFLHWQLSLPHALGTQTLSGIRTAAFLDLQLLSTPAKLCDSAFPWMFRIVTRTRASVLRAVRVWLRRDARARTSASQRTGGRLPVTDAAVAEAVGGANPCLASSGFVLASALLRLQRVERKCKFVEKLRYIHRNPVVRGVERPEDWQWSSFGHYLTGADGAVKIESQWTARRRERLGIVSTVRVRESPPKRSLNGAP
jgi:hypothetical protein